VSGHPYTSGHFTPGGPSLRYPLNRKLNRPRAGQDVSKNKKKNSSPGRIRTPDRPARSLVIYSQFQLPPLFYAHIFLIYAGLQPSQITQFYAHLAGYIPCYTVYCVKEKSRDQNWELRKVARQNCGTGITGRCVGVARGGDSE